MCPQVRYDCIRKEDISGIASCVFTKNGQGEKNMLEFKVKEVISRHLKSTVGFLSLFICVFFSLLDFYHDNICLVSDTHT